MLADKSLQNVFDFTGKEGEIVRLRGQNVSCGDVNQWARIMRTDGAWGDSSVIQIFANITGITVHVVPRGHSDDVITHYCPRQGICEDAAFPICLGYGHFQVLVSSCLPHKVTVSHKETIDNPVIIEIDDDLPSDDKSESVLDSLSSSVEGFDKNDDLPKPSQMVVASNWQQSQDPVRTNQTNAFQKPSYRSVLLGCRQDQIKSESKTLAQIKPNKSHVLVRRPELSQSNSWLQRSSNIADTKNSTSSVFSSSTKQSDDTSGHPMESEHEVSVRCHIEKIKVQNTQNYNHYNPELHEPMNINDDSILSGAKSSFKTVEYKNVRENTKPVILSPCLVFPALSGMSVFHKSQVESIDLQQPTTPNKSFVSNLKVSENPINKGTESLITSNLLMPLPQPHCSDGLIVIKPSEQEWIEQEWIDQQLKVSKTWVRTSYDNETLETYKPEEQDHLLSTLDQETANMHTSNESDMHCEAKQTHAVIHAPIEGADREVGSSYIGLELSSIDSAKDLVRSLSDSDYSNMIVGTNNKRGLVFICSCFRHRKSQSKGIRVNNHYNYTGCLAKIRFSKLKDGRLKLTRLNINHNHKVSKYTHDKKNQMISEEEAEFLQVFKKVNIKPSVIKEVIKLKFKKDFPTRKIQWFMSEQSKEIDDFEGFLQDLESSGGIVDWKENDLGEVTTIFISTAGMKSAFCEAQPPLVQIDTTFHVGKGCYKLVGIAYLDPKTDSTAWAGFGLMDCETNVNFHHIFSELKKQIKNEKQLFLIDKDFKEIITLQTVFPGCVVLLCRFHVIAYMHKITATAVIPVSLKNSIMQSFTSLLYSHSEEDYRLKLAAFINEVYEVYVSPPGNSGPILYVVYFQRNWANCPEMWVTYKRRDLVTLMDNTTNRLERLFRTVKEALKTRFKG